MGSQVRVGGHVTPEHQALADGGIQQQLLGTATWRHQLPPFRGLLHLEEGVHLCPGGIPVLTFHQSAPTDNIQSPLYLYDSCPDDDDDNSK